MEGRVDFNPTRLFSFWEKIMSEQEIKFLSREKAVALVGAIQEEEDIHNDNRRILTVYNHEDKEVCWFDFEEILDAVGEVPKDEKVAAVQEYVLNHLPEWAEEV